MTPFLAHSTPFRSRRSLAKVSTNAGEAQGFSMPEPGRPRARGTATIWQSLPDRRGSPHLLGDGAVTGKCDESVSGPATLGTTAKAGLLLRTWCNRCRRWVD